MTHICVSYRSSANLFFMNSSCGRISSPPFDSINQRSTLAYLLSDVESQRGSSTELFSIKRRLLVQFSQVVSANLTIDFPNHS